jgi:hypothetical protein
MAPGRGLGRQQELLTLSLSPPEGRRSGNLLNDIRKLELKYSRRPLGKAKLVIEYVVGRLKVFEVDRFLIQRRYTYASRVSYRVREDQDAGICAITESTEMSDRGEQEGVGS